MVQRNGRASNSLRHELTLQVEQHSEATPEAVYDVLSHLRTHAVWGGERQSKTTRILTIDAPEEAVSVGTEFATTGADPMGSFTDRSVVTEATSPSVLEFVTEARLDTKKGVRSDWTNVHRYELRPSGSGCDITYSLRVARVSALPGMLRVFNLPVLSGLAMKASSSVARRGVANLAAMAEARVGAQQRISVGSPVAGHRSTG